MTRLFKPLALRGMTFKTRLVVSPMRDHPRTEPLLAAVIMAAQRQRPAEGLICHSALGYRTPEQAEPPMI